MFDEDAHVLVEGQPATARGGVPGAAFAVEDWLGRTVAGAEGIFDNAGTATVPPLPAGYYRMVSARFPADTAATSRTSVVSDVLATIAVVSPPQSAIEGASGSTGFLAADTGPIWEVARGESFLCPWNGGDAQRTLADLARLCGVTHVRDRLSPGGVMPKPDLFDGSFFLRNAGLFAERGIGVCETFATAPAWTAPKDRMPTDLAAVWTMCARLAAEFGGRMDAWEFWNEPDIGFIDFLRLNDGATAVFGKIAVDNASPARILFNGGELHWSHSTGASLAIQTLSPATGSELILEGINGNPVKFSKTDRAANFTGQKGGTVRFRGGDVILSADRNDQRWLLSTADNVVWEQTGDLVLKDGLMLTMGNGYRLPYGAGNGILRLSSSGAAAAQRAILNMPNHDQPLNGVVAEGDGARFSMVTNTTTTVRTIFLDTAPRNIDVPFGIACSSRIKVQKKGTGRMEFVGNTDVTDFEIAAACPVSFAGTNRFVNLAYKGATLPSFAGEVWIDGVLDLSALASGTYDLPQTLVHLGPSGSIRLPAGAMLNLPRGGIDIGGVKVGSGVYDSSATWLSAGHVTVGIPATVMVVR